MKKKICIIGANSYIARNMVYVLNNRYAGYDILLYDYQDSFADGASGYKKINVLCTESIQEIDLDVDLVFVFTGKTGTAVGFDEYESFIDLNEKALLNILSEYHRQKSKAKIIYPSTRLVYKGLAGQLKEDSEKEFKTIYAVNKYASEQYLKIYSSAYGVRYCIFRACVPYGSFIHGASSYGTAEFMLGRAQKGEEIVLFGDGSARRTLTYIEDLCESMILGALSTSCENDVFNIGGEDYSLNEMASLIADKYGVPVKYEDWPEMALKVESGDTVFDSGKLDGIIKYNRNMTFKDWLRISPKL
ncbi:MAG: SDR family oxidoreductase [Oscillospiraceae bacterium]|nr:SDR family oxidoreductase [Oscillospiraceae bacterium]